MNTRGLLAEERLLAPEVDVLAVRRLVARRGLSAAELARRADLSVGRVKDLLERRAPVRVNDAILDKLAAALGVGRGMLVTD